MKRILLFMGTNLLVVLTISIVLNLLGFRGYMEAGGINYSSLFIFCLVWGMGGAFISLALSKTIAKWTTRMQILKPGSPEGGDLVELVHEAAKRAGLPKMPEVGIYHSDDVNAFATGPSKSNSLVAFSTGALEKLSSREIAGIAGHEAAHIANGDMVTMTLVQGVINAFVMFFARIIAWAIAQRMRGEGRYMMQFVVTMVLEIAFSFLGMFVVSWFSRQREYRADEGGAKLMGRENMIAALSKLARVYHKPQNKMEESDSLATLKISGRSKGLLALLSTHPGLQDRIERLKRG